MRVSAAWAALTERVGATGLPLREFMVDANDGVIATAGVVEGLSGAGIARGTILLAAISATLAGAVALGGVKYAEVAAERDEVLALVAEQRRQLALTPAEEAAELAALYEAKGLSPDLARQVAAELGRRDPLAAHVEAEHGLDLATGPVRPLPAALLATLAFTLGAGVPLLTVVLVSDENRTLATFAAVVVSLAVTSTVQARAGRTAVWRTVARTVLVGVVAMLLAYVAGVVVQP